MKISIIIPHFNSLPQLDRLLNTIPICPDIEVIVIDDHSPERPTICSSRTNTKLILNNSKGAGSARNLGIKNSDGDWLLFADADDYFLEGTFDLLSAKLSTSSSEVIYFPPTSYNEETKSTGTRHLIYSELVNSLLSNKVGTEANLRTKFLVPWSKAIKRTLVEREAIEFDDVRFSNDVMFSIKVGILANTIEVSDLPIYSVTESDSSLTKNRGKSAFDTRLAVAIRYNSYLVANGYAKQRMPLLKFLIWSRQFGMLCFFKTYFLSVTGNNKLIDAFWFKKYNSLASIIRMVKNL